MNSDKMDKQTTCSQNVDKIQKPIDGCMFVAGKVISINLSGSSAVVIARGGGGRYIQMHISNFFVNGELVSRKKNFHHYLERGSTINLFIEELATEKNIVSFRVSYLAALSWVGKEHSEVPRCGPYKYFWESLPSKHECEEHPKYYSKVDYSPTLLKTHYSLVYWCCNTYGLAVIWENNKLVTHVLITVNNFYLNGRRLPDLNNLQFACAANKVHILTKPIPRQKIFSVDVDQEAVVAYIGSKPNVVFDYVSSEELMLGSSHTGSKKISSVSEERLDKIPPIHSKKNLGDDLEKHKFLTTKPVNNGVSDVAPEKKMKVASYFTGRYLGSQSNYFYYGNQTTCCKFSSAIFHGFHSLDKSPSALLQYFKRKEYVPTLHGYIAPLPQDDKFNEMTVSWEAVCVWHGPAPESLKMQINSLRKVPLRVYENKQQVNPFDAELMVDRKDLTRSSKEKISAASYVKKGRLTGYVINCSASDAIMNGFANSVYFTRERFYVNKNKYRGPSLLSFFQKKNYAVNAYIVTMREKNIRGFCVSSRAVCAWVGDEPNELKPLIMKEKLYSNYEEDDARGKERQSLYYFSGFVSRIGETHAVAKCKVENQTVTIGFSINELYLYGKKASSRSIMSMHVKPLMASRWCFLAHYLPENSTQDVDCIAVAVWHHTDQVAIFDDLQNKLPLWHQRLLGSPCVCAAHIAKLTVKPFTNVNKGSISERQKDNVAIVMKNVGMVWMKLNQIIIDGCVCYFSAVDQMRMCYVVFDSHNTPLYAWMGLQPQNKSSNRGEDWTHVDCESDDSDCEDDEVSNEGFYDDVRDEIDNDSWNLSTAEASDPSELIDLARTVKVMKISRPQKDSSPKQELDEFSGVFAQCKIVSIEGDRAILTWLMPDIQGTIFVQLDVAHLYINGDAFRNSCYTKYDGDKALTNYTCQAFVNSLPVPILHGSLEICTVASVCWIGDKPIFIPAAGKQKQGILDRKCLRIACTKPPNFTIEFCSIGDWLLYCDDQKNTTSNAEYKPTVNHTKKSSVFNTAGCQKLPRAPSGPAVQRNIPIATQPPVTRSAASNGSAVCHTSQSTNVPAKVADSPKTSLDISNISSQSNKPSNATQPGSVSQSWSTNYSLGSHLNLPSNNTTGQASYNPPTSLPTASRAMTNPVGINSQSQFQAVSATTNSYSTLDNISTGLPNTSCGINIPSGGPQVNTCDNSHTGTVVELHAALGKIRGTDGVEHYFKPDQFSLYGVPLNNVELYNILVQGIASHSYFAF